MAFDTVNVPPAALITRSYLRFKARYSSASSVTFTISGEKSPRADTLKSIDYDISSRSKTSNSVSWNAGSWSAGLSYETPDITSIVQEVISQNGWRPGNPVNFFIEGTSGDKAALSGEIDGPELIVEYTLPNKPYVVAIDSNCLKSGSAFSQLALAQQNSSGEDISFFGKPVLCYASANNQNGADQLLYMNTVSGERMQGHNNGNMGTYQVESITFFPGENILFGADSGHLGKIDMITGAFTAYSDSFGIAGGVNGEENLNDADGSTLNFFKGEYWAVDRKSNVKDYLFLVDTTTGRHVENAFGTGIDYIQISGTGILNDLDDLAIHPATGVMYGSNTFKDTSYAFLVTIDPASGLSTIIDTFK